MSKKIVAIGGGENGRIDSKGIKLPYETKKIDMEIIKLTGKERPNFLFLGHSQMNATSEINYFNTMNNIYADMYGCECKNIMKSDLLNNKAKVLNLIKWADIIYEGGGDTKGMINLWRDSGFDKILKQAWQDGKVMCGVSAGANCWFKTCSSDSLKLELNDDTAPLIDVDCLNFVSAFFTPHCNVANTYTNRLEYMKESLKYKDLVGIGISNCCALEIVDEQYRLITEDASNYGIKAYGIKTYWKNNQYSEEYIDDTLTFKSLSNLLSKYNK